MSGQPPTVRISLHATPEKHPQRPLSGRDFASDNPAADRLLEIDIGRRIDAGDVWAWATVEVRATHCLGFTGSDYLGGCCYVDEADFKRNSGYYTDMITEALDRLDAAVAAVLRRRDPAAGVTLWYPK